MSDPLRSALFTDLYELTMAQAYAAEGMEAPAVFELFFREMPAQRNYFVAAGLDDVLTCLEQLRFTEDDLEYLRRDQHLSAAFLDRLRGLRFTGDVYAMPEGTPAFGLSGRAARASRGADDRSPDRRDAGAQPGALPDRGGDQSGARGSRGGGAGGGRFRLAAGPRE
jgi:hypothetical protein